MKIKIFLRVKELTPYLMLLLMLSSIILTSFHNHNCTDSSDNCTVCSFRVSFSAVTIEPAIDVQLIQKPISDYAITLNDRVTDPSQKLVCSSHAPPQIS